jgi:hypothetical protein
LRLAARPGLWLTLICGLGFGLRFLLLDREPFWLDEAYSWGFAKLSLGRLWWEPLDLHPPVYYSLLHVLLPFGDSPWLMRMPSAVGGTLAVPLVYVLGRRVAGEWVGLAAALLLATSSIHIRYSQEARSYALLTDAALIVAIGFVGLFARPNLERRAIIAWSTCYCVGAVLALYLHYIAVLLVAVTFALGTLVVARERSAPLMKAWGLANVLILAVWLWWLPVILLQLRQGAPTLSIPPPNLEEIARGIRSLYGEPHVYWEWQGGPTFEALLLAAGLFGAWVAWQRCSVVGLLLAAVSFGIPVLEIGLSWVVKPVFMERTIIWLVPFFLLLVTIGLMRLPRAGIAGFVLVLAMQVIGTLTYFRTELSPEPWPRLAALLHSGLCPGDLVLVAPGYLQLPFDYATRNDPKPMRVFDIGVNRGNTLLRRVAADEILARVREAIATKPPIWVVTYNSYIDGPFFNLGIAPILGDYKLVERRGFRALALSHYAAIDQSGVPRCVSSTTAK